MSAQGRIELLDDQRGMPDCHSGGMNPRYRFLTSTSAACHIDGYEVDTARACAERSAADFRYGTAPLPALGALAGFDHIAYVGTFSKVLSPAIRLGFVVTRADLVEAMAKLVAQARDSVSIMTQRIIAWLISSGELEKHVRRVRRSYAERRATMLQALSEIPQIQSVTGQAAGLHVVVRLGAEFRLKALAAQLERHGIVVDRVADFQLGRQSDDRVLMAYGHLAEPDIVEGVRRFGAAIRLVAPHS